jgi:hypothetical protein
MSQSFETRIMILSRRLFREVDLADPFFDSLKQDYGEFPNWFATKANEPAYVSQDEDGNLNGFLFLKIEEGRVSDTVPPLPTARRLKVGTFKIHAHGTRLGERFIKKIFDNAVAENIDEIYLTLFARHEGLSSLFSQYGFSKRAEKTSQNGTEDVLVRRLYSTSENILASYPVITLRGHRAYLLSLYPQWHTRLLPDSKLHLEGPDLIKDVAHTNSIHKVYLCGMSGVEHLRTGDVLVIYRTTDNKGPAHYRSVATSVCVVEEYRPITSFTTLEEFMRYCAPYSVFTETELQDFWRRRSYPHVIRFSYNIALQKRVTRKSLIEECGMDGESYWGFLPLNSEQFSKLIEKGKVNESLIVH